MVNLPTKFEDSMFTLYKDSKGNTKVESQVVWVVMGHLTSSAT